MQTSKPSKERGQALILIALAAIGLVGIAGLAIDGSAKFSDRRHAQNAADSAALVASLDLVICVDTAVGHLAGALGKPVWVLLPACRTDWRWGYTGEASAWYPDVMRLFRQARRGDWDTVLARVAAALQVLAAERPV